MSIYKRGNVYWYKFMWNGEMIRESTRQGNDKKARNIESAHRTALANGLVGIREKKPAPPLADFLKNDFQPFVEAKHTAKPATAEYYVDGANMVRKCDWASLPLDKISDQHAQQFAAKYARLSASRINCGLRSLRRALNLAFEWGKLERPVKITLAKGEKQRDRILTDSDWQCYIEDCPQPWKDAATLVRGTGMRPGEAFALRWENIHLNGSGGLIQVTDGKTKAARRMLPMVPTVHTALTARWEAAGKPEEGWLFPTTSKEGHLNKDTAKDQHKRALDRANAKAKSEGRKEIPPFQPYILRHTALTQLANAGCDVFTLARIAGHSSITITQRYVHPQADAIERAFLQQEIAALPAQSEAGRHRIGHSAIAPNCE